MNQKSIRLCESTVQYCQSFSLAINTTKPSCENLLSHTKQREYLNC